MTSTTHDRVTRRFLPAVLAALGGLAVGPSIAGEIPFCERTITHSANGAQSVFAADLDGDGDIDLLGASYLDGTIAWFENDGETPPSFTEHVITSSSAGAGSVWAADVDGDGDLDALGASFWADTIAWFENDGGTPPTFTEHVLSDSSESARSVAAADIDGDGDTDVLGASSEGDTVVWFENVGGDPPAFTERLILLIDGARQALPADIDGDGDTDVLSGSSFEGIAWHENDGGVPPSFTTHPVPVSTSEATSVFAADMDGDGDVDILNASYSGNMHFWYENDGGTPPTFTERVFADDSPGARSVVAADIDGDGDNDALVTAALADRVAWYENDGGSPPTLTRRVISTGAKEAQHAIAADLDGDGDADVASVSRDDDTIAWYENDPTKCPEDTPYCARVLSSEPPGAKAVLGTDIDGDGDLDVVGATLEEGILWFENHRGMPPCFEAHLISAEVQTPFSIYATDVDGDGHVDVLSASKDDDTVAWYESDGGTPPAFTRRVITDTANAAFSVYATDLDADGDTDVLSASSDDDTIAWYESDGGAPPAFTPRVLTSSANGARSVYAADVDGDGDVDVLGAAWQDSTVRWFESDGGAPPTFTERVVYDGADGANSVFAADVDGDGDIDVLSASFWDNLFAWYENDGGSPPNFTTHVIDQPADDAIAVFATDVDGDGDIDVLGASLDDETIAWYENDGGALPQFTRHVITEQAFAARGVHAADVDGDGDTDILGASFDSIAWYEREPIDCSEPVPSTCPADADGDGAVGTEDLIIVILSWGCSAAACLPCTGDVNGDGSVDVNDLTALVLGWGACTE